MQVTLYARNLEGKIKTWGIIKLDSITASITYGLFNGNLQTDLIDSPTIDTTIASRIAKKRKEGYKSLSDLSYININNETIHDFLKRTLPACNTDNNGNLKPMKCQPFKERKMAYPVFGQPKLNGLRCVLRWETIESGTGIFKNTSQGAVLRTKEGLQYVMPHITSGLVKEQFYHDDIELVYDGELYCPGITLNLIKASCPMTNSKGTVSKSSGTPNDISFHIFDLAIPDVSQTSRFSLMYDHIKFYGFTCVHLKYVPFRTIASDDEALAFRNECLEIGYEGCVLRDRWAEYAFGFRPSFIRKYKTHMDGEFLVVNIIEQTDNPGMPLFVLKNDINSETFECNPTGTEELKRMILRDANDYIGKYATVRYRERSGVKKVPFHANVMSDQGFRNSPSSDK